MRKDLTVLIKEKVDSINVVLDVIDIQSDVIYLCNTLHLTIGKIIEDPLGSKYKIVDFLLNEWIKVVPYSGAPAQFVGVTVTCPEIHYFHGAPQTFNEEYNTKNASTREKTPVIWLLEHFEEDFFGRERSIERKSKFRVFFLDETNEEEWTAEQHHLLVIQPLMNLSDAFVNEFAKDKTFKTIELFTERPRIKFGKYVDDRGNERKIVDENFSAVELSAAFEKFKSTKCKNC